MRNHFFFKIKTSDLKEADSIETIIKNFKLPENEFPPRFFVKEKDFFVGGYFVSYNPKLTTQKIVTLCQNKSWGEIAHFHGDFLIIYFDLKERKFFVLTDQTGKFPCYFSGLGETMILSTSFHGVFKSLSSLRLNIERTLEFIYRDIQVTDKTIIEGVYLLPPATLGEFRSDGTYELKTLLDTEEFLNTPFERYSSLEKFASVFLETIDGFVKERLNTLGEVKYCAELSSGLDSSLISYLIKKNSSKSFVCYSEIAKSAIGDTQPEVVLEFVNKHKLRIEFVKYDHLFPFSTSEDLEWIKQGPSYIQKSQVYNFLTLLRKNGNAARLTGEGGDEAYWSNNDALNLELRFPIQKQYFDFQAIRRYGIDKILTEKGTKKLFDKERFRQKCVYPLFVSNSVATLFRDTFTLGWETKVWPITPFADSRVIQITRGIPSKGIEKAHLKQKIWQKRDDIFTKSQFREKIGTEEHYSRFFTEKVDFVTSTLKNSILGKSGWVRSSEIVTNISKGQTQTYYDGDTLAYLVNLLELEYFIQQNNIKVP